MISSALVSLFPSLAGFGTTKFLGGKFIWAIVVAAGIADSINPCAFSVLLITIAFLFSAQKTRTKILQLGGLYIFGIFLIYLVIGLTGLKLLYLISGALSFPHLLAKVGAILIIAIGIIDIIGHFNPNFPIKFGLPKSSKPKIASLMAKGSLPAIFMLGIMVGLFEFPCTGGPYLMIIGLLHDTSTFTSGVVYLFFYNIIFILPLIVILVIASNKGLLEKVQTWKEKGGGTMDLWSAIIMITLGIIILLL